MSISSSFVDIQQNAPSLVAIKKLYGNLITIKETEIPVFRKLLENHKHDIVTALYDMKRILVLSSDQFVGTLQQSLKKKYQNFAVKLLY